ncbi:MAG: putative acyltransferase [Bacteroidota bacterium]|nr:putative acyltransferase [Bacteroidota bacterium]
MEKTRNGIYFPSLNGIRFLAAFLVLIHHMEQMKELNHVSNFMSHPFFQMAGEIGVTIFFTLSGFLISYLLLVELNSKKRITIKAFYIRRILRIWPLYFIILLISLLTALLMNTLDFDFFTTKFVLYVTFLANIAFVAFSAGGFPSQIWSVATEEQFYLLWPWLMRWTKGNIFRLTIVIIIIFIALRALFSYFTIPQVNFGGVNLWQFMGQFINYFRIDCMAIGGLFAFILYRKYALLSFLYSKFFQLFTIILICGSMFFGFKPGIFYYTYYASLSAILILNVASNTHSLINLEYSFFDLMGKISYGFYMYHPIVLIVLSGYLFRNLNMGSNLGHFIYFLISFILTTVISYFSFTYIEGPFLKLKHKYAIIVSGNDGQK